MENDRTAARVTAALLDSAKMCLPFNLLFAAVGCWLMQGWLAVLWLLLALLAAYWHVRTAFDAKLFRHFSDGLLMPEELDKALFDLSLRKQMAERNMPSRCRGAVGLWKRLLMLTAVQGVWLAVVCVF